MQLNLLHLKINRHLKDLRTFRIIIKKHYIMNEKAVLFITSLMLEIKVDISKGETTSFFTQNLVASSRGESVALGKSYKLLVSLKVCM